MNINKFVSEIFDNEIEEKLTIENTNVVKENHLYDKIKNEFINNSTTVIDDFIDEITNLSDNIIERHKEDILKSLVKTKYLVIVKVTPYKAKGCIIKKDEDNSSMFIYTPSGDIVSYEIIKDDYYHDDIDILHIHHDAFNALFESEYESNIKTDDDIKIIIQEIKEYTF